MPTRTIIVKDEAERGSAIAAVQQAKMPFSVVIRPPMKKYRRSQQNLLFAVIRYIAIEAGNVGRYECKQFENDMLKRHLGVKNSKMKMMNGDSKDIEERRSTTELNRDQMTWLIDGIVCDAANYGIIVPKSDEMMSIANSSPFYDK